MADADTVRGAGVPDRAPAPGSPAPGSPAPGAAVSGETVMSLVDHLSELRTRLIRCLLAFTDATLVATLAAPPYFDFVTTMFLVFGLLMEFPIVLYALARVGIVSSARLRSSRRITILGIAIFAAVATPGGDLVSPTVLGFTMYILFELTIVAIRRSGR